MKLSARNQFLGKVIAIEKGSVNGIVSLDVKGLVFSATISMTSIDGLGLEAGRDAYAIIKATEVMIGNGEMVLSARNQFKGTIKHIERGAVSAIVTLELKAGMEIVSTISLASVDRLGLEEGSEAVAVVKATSVMIGVK